MASLPPPPGNAQKNAVSKRTNLPVFSGSQSQTLPVITNNDIFAMMRQVKNQMDEQTRANQCLFKELEEIKKSRKPVEEMTPLLPRTLNFGSAGSSLQQPQMSSAAYSSGTTFLHRLDPESSSAQEFHRIPKSSSVFSRNPQNQASGSSMMHTSRYEGLSSSGPAFVSQAGSAEVHNGDFIPMQTNTPTGPSYSTRTATIGIPNQDPRMPVQIPDAGNMTTNTSFIPNSVAVQPAGISSELAKELQNIRNMISSVPGIMRPIPEMPVGSYKFSRFAWPICDVEIPKRFQTPSMKLYDGTTDPEEHVAQYRERMEINPIPLDIKEACLCKGFGSTLTGPALKWLLSIPANTITSFSHLINLFHSQFSCSRSFEKLTSDLYRITQKSNESLRDLITRFSREALDIPNLDMPTAVEAFRMSLNKDSPFYEDLVMTPCRNLDEVRSRAIRFIRLEDDKKLHKKLDIPKNDLSNKKSESPGKQYRNRPYPKNDNHRVNAIDEDSDDEDYPLVSEYCFSTDTTGLMCAMQDLGEKARWPRKNEKQASWKDKSKWCAFHEDFGHITDECIALRREISYLLSKGHLKELLGRKKSKTQDAERVPERAPSPPPNAKVINFISGGSDICGTSYSAAKKRAKENKLDNGEKPIRTTTLTNQKSISFEETDRGDVQDPHHDGLVITLCIANCFVRRILIDGGSSVNIIQLEALKKMGIPESDIISRSSVLVGFSGETKNTVGDIKLPIYIEGVNSLQKFCVIDTLSCCNVILGRPWIHDMKAVPSTYHQCVKLPSPWGIVKIESDQQEAKDCYTSSMKPAARSQQA
jgi:hypothetical protein